MRCEEFELAYCTNVHPGEGLAALHAILDEHVTRVRQRVAPALPFAAGLRLGVEAADALQRPEAALALADRLRDAQLYTFTANGFPYGDFAAPSVKQNVYRPSWLDAERVRYTLALARALAALPGPATRSLSTVAGAFRPDGDDHAAHAQMAHHLSQCAEGLARIADETGVSVRLCLEPEPGTTLERVEDALRFFADHLGLRGGRYTGPAAQAHHDHLGLCFDCCHQAVLFEDVTESLDALLDAGIAIGKVQISSALELRAPADPEARATLFHFAEPRYLHQTAAQLDGGEVLFALDLGQIPQGAEPEAHRWRTARAWRTHFHVPIWWAGGGHLSTTQAQWQAVVRRLKARLRAGLPSCTQLEIETYTWQVIPEAQRLQMSGGDLHGSIAAEYAALRAVIEERP